MPTFYECYQRFLKRKGALPFGRRKYKVTIFKVSKIWNKKNLPPLPLVESIEGDKTYQVRQYPDTFLKTIDAIILSGSNLAIKRVPKKPAKEKRARKPIDFKIKENLAIIEKNEANK